MSNKTAQSRSAHAGISRRRLLIDGGRAALALPVLTAGLMPLHARAAAPSAGHALPSANSPLQLASSVKTDHAGHQLLRLTGSEPSLQKSGWRGHQAVGSPDGRFLVSVARRPDRQLLIEDRQEKQHYFVDADAERHFYGHGLFSPDGRWFYTPENDYDNVRGVIGQYDVSLGFKKVAEWDSGGVGPHQIAFLPLTAAEQQAGQHPVMVVANGGIETHPDYPRIKLNPETMQPNISYLDGRGKCLQQLTPPHHQLSLRHLDVAADGQVWVGAQYQGEVFESPNLIYRHRLGQPQLIPVTAPDHLWPDLKGYIASISCHPTADTVCITAPRDNRITFWQRSSGKWLAEQSLPDCAGACAHPNLPVYYVSSGNGTLAAYNAETGQALWQQPFAGIHWDNHLTWIG